MYGDWCPVAGCGGEPDEASPVTGSGDSHPPQAVELYSKAIELHPANAVYHANRSISHLRLENYGYALADASKAIEADKTYLKAYYRCHHPNAEMWFGFTQAEICQFFPQQWGTLPMGAPIIHRYLQKTSTSKPKLRFSRKKRKRKREKVTRKWY